MKRKWLLVSLVIVIMAVLAGGYYWQHKDSKPKGAQAAALPTVRVQKGKLEVTVSGKGSIEPVDRETVTTADTGTIQEVKVKEGDSVHKGDVIATLESTDISDQIEAAKVSLEKQQLDLENMQDQLKTANPDQIDSVKLSIRKQQLDIESSRQKIADLEDQQSSGPIVSPIDGVITSLGVKAGDDVNPKVTIAEVSDYQHLQLVVGVDELDIPKVKVGQPATITVDALTNKDFSSKVVKIADEGTSSNGVATFDVTLNIDDITGLKAGMSAEASILTDSKNDALYVPINAVQSFNNRYFVMVPSSGAGAAGAAGQSGASGARGNGGSNAGNSGRQTSSGQGSGSVGGANPANGASGGTNRQWRGSAPNNSGFARKEVQVGIHNEDFIEIVSGLSEGDSVMLPQTAASTGSQQNQFRGPGGGFGGGFGGGGVRVTTGSRGGGRG